MPLKLNNIRTKSGQQNVQVEVDKTPDACPICHRSINPLDLSVAYRMDDSTVVTLERIMQCPAENCQRYFIARYRCFNKPNGIMEGRLYQSVPTELNAIEFSKIISDISPDYCEIFSQAHKAEQAKLDLVAGPGYRKALEFLIKDYLLKTHTDPTERAEIEKMLLGKCISTYISNDMIKQTASRAAWLGNDETHFVRKWIDKDLSDLKVLIGLTVRWIEMEKMTEEIIGGMPTGKP
jgi:hypothetical protein